MSNDTKDNTVRLRISDRDLAAWEAAAKQDRRTLSDYIRMRVEGLTTTEPTPSLVEREAGRTYTDRELRVRGFTESATKRAERKTHVEPKPVVRQTPLHVRQTRRTK